MNTTLIVLIVLAALALVTVIFVVGIYNKLVSLRNRFKNAYAQIDVQLKRRYDLIPNLVETAKGYLKHERGTLAAVSILREHLLELKVRVINVVDLMKLQPQSEHPHGLSDDAFDAPFTKDKHVIFAFHAYPWLIHRLTYRRTNHANIHVRGYKEEGTITTPFDMTVMNDLDRFHLVMDTIDRLPQTGKKGRALKEQLQAKLIEHKQYIDKNGQDLPEIRNWKWNVDRVE